MKSKLASLLLLAAVASQLGSTDCGQVLRDPGFDLWCGDSLCAWKLERGNISEVPTWNQGDPGVSFDGSDVAIEQFAPVNDGDGTCLQFDLIANISETAAVTLNIDIEGDGTIEKAEQLPTSNWKPLSYLLNVTPSFDGIRFELAKTGPGTAVIAQIDAQIVDASMCTGLPTITSGPRPDGARCEQDSDCNSNSCIGAQSFGPPGTCQGCAPVGSGTCPSDQVCGLVAPTAAFFAIPNGCVENASKPLGELCAVSAECASGICDFVCSACETGGCPNGQMCGPDWTQTVDSTSTTAGPWVCAPHASMQPAGSPCASDDDCASSACAGTVRMQCDDGRECATAADCPFDTEPNENGLQNGPCNTVGVQGGICQ